MSFLTMLAPITVTGCRNGCSCIPRCIWSGYPSEVHNSTLWKPCGVGSNPKWLVTGPIPTSNPSKSRVGNNWINLRQSRLSENRGYLPERRDRTFDYLLTRSLRLEIHRSRGIASRSVSKLHGIQSRSPGCASGCNPSRTSSGFLTATSTSSVTSMHTCSDRTVIVWKDVLRSPGICIPGETFPPDVYRGIPHRRLLRRFGTHVPRKVGWGYLSPPN